MECERCREAVSARLDGEPPGASDAEIDGHLAACAACRQITDRSAEVTGALRALAAEPAPDLVDRVLDRWTGGSATVVALPTCPCASTCACGCQQGAACRCGGHRAA